MSQPELVIPHLQGLWMIPWTAPQNSLINRSQRDIKYSTLRDRINVKNEHVINISPSEFWKQHEERIKRYYLTPIAPIISVALFAGSLDRDRAQSTTWVL